jgi:GNAT superfamily N-acetyltransferase
MNLAIRDDVSGALPLMEEVMRGGEALAPDYPLIFGEGQAGRVAIAEEAGSIVSGCAILERELVFPGASPTVGLIGSVSTSAKHRGRGLATAVLERAEEAFRSEGCLFALLWAEDPRFYEGRNYQHVGAETDFVLTEELIPLLPESSGVRMARQDDFTGMHLFYTQHAIRAERSEAESLALFDTPGMTIVVHESGEEIDAYACLDRGHDLTGVIHEWGGDVEGVLACLRHLLASRAASLGDQPLFLMAPLPAGGVGEQLSALGAASLPGVLGMGKLLDEEAAIQYLLGASEVPLIAKPGATAAWILESPAGTVEMASSDLLAALFSPRGERELIAALERTLHTRFPALPWTPFLWGLDSI